MHYVCVALPVTAEKLTRVSSEVSVGCVSVIWWNVSAPSQ